MRIEYKREETDGGILYHAKWECSHHRVPEELPHTHEVSGTSNSHLRTNIKARDVWCLEHPPDVNQGGWPHSTIDTK